MSEVINFIVVFGILLGGIDKLRGNKLGYGAKFEEAFGYIAPMAFSMVGMICLSNYLAIVLERFVSPLLRLIHMDSSIIAGFLAIDMGGFQLA